MQHKKLQKIPEKQENSKYNVLVHFVQKKKQNETHPHLFFTCEYCKIVWKDAIQCSNMNINTSNWQEVMQYMQSQCKEQHYTSIDQNYVECNPIYDLERKECQHISGNSLVSSGASSPNQRDVYIEK